MEKKPFFWARIVREGHDKVEGSSKEVNQNAKNDGQNEINT